LSVVGAERTSEDFLGVASEEALGLTSLKVPQPHGLVPRGGDEEVIVIGQGHVGDEVGVTVEALERHSIDTIFTGFAN